MDGIAWVYTVFLSSFFLLWIFICREGGITQGKDMIMLSIGMEWIGHVMLIWDFSVAQHA
jgi:hypothetical protein